MTVRADNAHITRVLLKLHDIIMKTKVHYDMTRVHIMQYDHTVYVLIVHLKEMDDCSVIET